MILEFWFHSYSINWMNDILDELFRTENRDTPSGRICKRLRSTEGEIGGALGSHCLDGQDEIQDYLNIF